ncbi:TetR/AcrR family transcriptional regulator [Paraburkholderia megapolitana]|uniref:TetR/AcrR family transcriptional regulator n=1 Tax=Paraburkholderia megapolitana TaxID=420953 RepID=UPI003908A5A3
MLDAAEEVFGTYGFEGGSMREIAQAAGVAQSLIHYHYKDKMRSIVPSSKEGRRRYAPLVDNALSNYLPRKTRRNWSPFSKSCSTRFTSFWTRGKDFRFYLQMVAEVTTSASPARSTS